MGNLGIFVDRQTLGNSEQLATLIRGRDVTEALGHSAYFLFPVELKKITQMDALFIRSRTDPMNVSYVASRLAELNGIPVIDDPRSILICSDKVNMYSHLMRASVSIPKTEFVSKTQLSLETITRLFQELGPTIVLKEPSTSFSVRVEKVQSVEDFMRTAKRFIRLSDWFVVEEYIESDFDWRIGILDGEMLYACKYIIPSETFKIQASVNGHIVYCTVESVPVSKVPEHILILAKRAAEAIGDGLYGIDIKESGGRSYVIEVNDNPSLEGGEDELYPDIWERIIRHLFDKAGKVSG
jgi:glutathione synthase/RimK-type ligase-like ATP-grasp enzyme